MLEVTGLDAFYGDAQALHGVDLRVGEGEVVTLVGRNGAGKTTLLRCVMGLHHDVRGTITLDGTDITGAPPHRRARKGLGWVQDDRGVYASLSVEENLTLPPVTDPGSAWSLAQVYEAFPVLADRRSARACSRRTSSGATVSSPRPSARSASNCASERSSASRVR